MTPYLRSNAAKPLQINTQQTMAKSAKGRYTPNADRVDSSNGECVSPQFKMKNKILEISHESNNVIKMQMSSKVFSTGMDSINAKGTA